MRKARTKCEKCGTEVRKFRFLIKSNGIWLCKKCVKEKRKKRLENIKKTLGITKEQELEEEQEITKDNRRKYNEKNKERLKKYHKEYNQKKKIIPKIRKSAVPKIKSIREKRLKISVLGLYITKVEKSVLWRKLKRKGLTSQEADERIKKLCKRMEMIKEKLKDKVKTQKEFNQKFKEEFAKLVEGEQ